MFFLRFEEVTILEMIEFGSLLLIYIIILIYYW